MNETRTEVCEDCGWEREREFVDGKPTRWVTLCGCDAV